MATNVKRCSLCQDDLKNTRLLPCIHSFCLECLEQYCRDKLPGDDALCPECKAEFDIPKDGVVDLPVSSSVPSELCEVCSADQRSEPATVYCDTCDQKLCERCSLPHKRMKGGPHEVRSLETVSSSKLLVESRFCDEHKEFVRMYCIECKTNVCLMCCVTSHKAHSYERIEKVAEDFARSIDDMMKPVTAHIDCLHGAAAQLAAEHSKTSENINAIELQVKARSGHLLEKFKELVDRNESELLAELQSLKSAAEKEVMSHRDALQRAVTEMESFRRSSLKLRSKGSRSDVSQARERAKKLLQTHVIPVEYHAPSYTFTPTLSIDELMKDDQNFIGHVNRQESSAVRVIKKISKDAVPVLAVTCLDDELFVLLERNVDQVVVYCINDYRLLRHLCVPGLQPDFRNDMTSCVRRRCLLMSDYKNRSVHNYDLTHADVSSWSVAGLPVGLSMTLSGNLVVTCREPNKLIEFNSASGKCLRQIELQLDIQCPWHGVQLARAAGQFVVGHGSWFTDLHRVCVVDVNGKVACSYGGQCGADVGQLHCPRHVAVDDDSQCIFAADFNNNRVVLLGPTLEFVRYISEALSYPYGLYFHQATRRLFVGQYNGDVTVIQM